MLEANCWKHVPPLELSECLLSLPQRPVHLPSISRLSVDPAFSWEKKWERAERKETHKKYCAAWWVRKK